MPVATATGLLPPPVLPQGEALYRSIMSALEPDLLPENLPTLKEKYANETPEQAAARSARYDAAFAAYDAQYATAITKLETQVHAYQHEAVASVEREDRAGEIHDLQSLEQSMTTL